MTASQALSVSMKEGPTLVPVVRVGPSGRDDLTASESTLPNGRPTLGSVLRVALQIQNASRLLCRCLS